MPNIAYKSEAEWLAIREMYIGGSEVASLFYRWRTPDRSVAVCHLYEQPPEGSVLLDCVSPYLTGYRLWHQKAGVMIPEDFGSAERVQAGTHLEPAIATWAQEKWLDLKLRKVRRYISHPTVPGWGASLDFEEVRPGYPPVEIKNVDGLIYREQWIEAEGEIVLPPLHLMLQQQAQIGAAEAERCMIIACVGGNELKRGMVDRHEPTQERIAEAITAFWHGVRQNIKPLLYADYETAAKLYAVKGGGPELGEFGDDMDAMLDQFRQLKEEQDGIDMRIENLQGQIAEKMGFYTKGNCARYKISWPVIERKEKLIPARVLRALTYRGGMTVTLKK